MLMQKIPNKTAYFTRRTRVKRVTQRHEAIPVRRHNPYDQLAVLQVLLFRFVLVSHGTPSLEYIKRYYIEYHMYILIFLYLYSKTICTQILGYGSLNDLVPRTAVSKAG